METTKHNRGNLVDFILWRKGAWNSLGLSALLRHSEYRRFGGALYILGGGDGLGATVYAGGWTGCVSLRHLLSNKFWAPVRAWARRRAKYLSEYYSKGAPTWTTRVCQNGVWVDEVRYARETFAYEIDPSDGRTIISAYISLPSAEAPEDDKRTWLHYSLWSSDAHSSSDNRKLPWNGTGWEGYRAWYWPWQEGPQGPR